MGSRFSINSRVFYHVAPRKIIKIDRYNFK